MPDSSLQSEGKTVPMLLPVEAVQLLYDVLGHFPYDRGSWSHGARAACSAALVAALDEPLPSILCNDWGHSE